MGSFNCRRWRILIVADGIYNCRWTAEVPNVPNDGLFDDLALAKTVLKNLTASRHSGDEEISDAPQMNKYEWRISDVGGGKIDHLSSFVGNSTMPTLVLLEQFIDWLVEWFPDLLLVVTLAPSTPVFLTFGEMRHEATAEEFHHAGFETRRYELDDGSHRVAARSRSDFNLIREATLRVRSEHS